MPIIRDSHRLMRRHDFWDLRPLILNGDGGGCGRGGCCNG
jgi:vanillate O-demethylase monooxygenase subunit